MGAPLGRRTDHVVRGDGRLLDGVVPVLDGDQLAVEERVGPARHVAGDEDVVEHHPFGAEDAARRVADHAPGVGGQSGAAQPLRVADGAEGDHRHVDVEHVAIGEVGATQPARLPPAP